MQMKARHEAKWLEFCDDIDKVARASRSGDTRKAVGAVLDTAGLISSAQAFDRSGASTSKPSHEDDLAAIQRAAALHPDLATFEAWLSQAMKRPSTTDGVTISSIHRVKGMERSPTDSAMTVKKNDASSMWRSPGAATRSWCLLTRNGRARS